MLALLVLVLANEQDPWFVMGQELESFAAPHPERHLQKYVTI